MVLAPYSDVAFDVNGFTRRPGLRVEIGYLAARRSAAQRAIFSAEGDPANILEPGSKIATPGPRSAAAPGAILPA